MSVIDIFQMIITLGLWALVCYVALRLIPMDDDDDDRGNDHNT